MIEEKPKRGGVRPGAGKPKGAISTKKRCPCKANTQRSAKWRNWMCCRKAGLMRQVRAGVKMRYELVEIV